MSGTRPGPGPGAGAAARALGAEAAGTFGLVVAATGSIVLDARAGFSLGLPFVAAMHFAGLAVLVAAFGRYSMAHFNPAVTVGFALAGLIRPRLVLPYIAAQAAGAVPGSLFVLHVAGDYAGLGASVPDAASHHTAVLFGAEAAATAILMGTILVAASLRGLPVWAAASAIAGAVALDVALFGPVSGGSMNPIRSLAPAAVSGMTGYLWLYWTAPFAGSLAVAAAYVARRGPRAGSDPQRGPRGGGAGPA